MLLGKHINKYYLKYLPVLLLGTIALLAVDYLQLLVPNLYQQVITGINDGEIVVDSVTGATVPFDMAYLLDKICLPMIFIILGMVVGRFAWRICFLGSAHKVEADLRDRMFSRCKDLSQEYYQVHKVGDLMSLFTNDIETIQECFAWGFMTLFDALALGFLAIFKMWDMNPVLTLLSLIPTVLLAIVGFLVDRAMMKKWEVRQEAFSALSDFSQESFSGIAVVKAFVKETAELMSFCWLNKKNEKANVDYTRISVLLNIFVTLAVESVICIILGYGGYLVHEDIFNAGQLVEFIGYFTAIIWPVMAISELIGMHSRGKASLNRISALLDTHPTVLDKPGLSSVEEIKGNIEFRDLTFNYPGTELNVLQNASFKINAGENVGIIGKTGSGKTTVVDLILRTYNVPDGTVFVDGIDINDIPIKDLRRHCAYVPQDNFLFSDTIENNIALATEGVTHESIIAASKMADIHDNIQGFTDKYGTVLGERGVTVSGGQKQRISIARAIIKDASILILDDSVSAVDVKTEAVILDNLRNNRRGKTTILIAHRISTVEGMDKIVFIDNGTVIDVGTHEELCSRCLEYRTMVELQKLDSQSEEV